MRSSRIRHRAARTSLWLLLIALGFACAHWSPPLAIGQRDSMAGQGIVLILTNTSEAPLNDLTVKVSAPDGTVKYTVIETLAPHASESVGWLRLEGWPIPTGAEIEVTAPEFRRSVRYQT